MATKRGRFDGLSADAILEAKPSAKPFRFGFLVHDVSRMRRNLFDLRMKPLGITRSQWSLLAALSRGGSEGLMQVDVARMMDVGKVTIGGLIQRLEKVGYVRRVNDEHDARAKRVFITDKGFDIIRQMQTLGTTNNEILLAGVSAEDLRITEDTLAKVKANIRAALDGKEPSVEPAAQPRAAKAKAATPAAAGGDEPAKAPRASKATASIAAAPSAKRAAVRPPAKASVKAPVKSGAKPAAKPRGAGAKTSAAAPAEKQPAVQPAAKSRAAKTAKARG